MNEPTASAQGTSRFSVRAVEVDDRAVSRVYLVVDERSGHPYSVWLDAEHARGHARLLESTTLEDSSPDSGPARALAEFDEHLRAARDHARAALAIPPPGAPAFYKSGRTPELDDQTIAPFG